MWEMEKKKKKCSWEDRKLKCFDCDEREVERWLNGHNRLSSSFYFLKNKQKLLSCKQKDSAERDIYM